MIVDEQLLIDSLIEITDTITDLGTTKRELYNLYELSKSIQLVKTEETIPAVAVQYESDGVTVKTPAKSAQTIQGTRLPDDPKLGVEITVERRESINERMLELKSVLIPSS